MASRKSYATVDTYPLSDLRKIGEWKGTTIYVGRDLAADEKKMLRRALSTTQSEKNHVAKTVASQYGGYGTCSAPGNIYRCGDQHHCVVYYHAGYESNISAGIEDGSGEDRLAKEVLEAAQRKAASWYPGKGW